MSREIEGVECSIEWCQKVSSYRRPKGYQSEFPVCQTHYWQWREWGEFREPKWEYSDTNGGCSVEGCDRTHKAKGLCETHWDHYKAGKPLMPLGPKKSKEPTAREKECTFPGCERPQSARGLCRRHWDCQKLGKPLVQLEPEKPKMPPVRERECTFPDCGRPQFALTFCGTHWTQQNAGQEMTFIKRGYEVGDKCSITMCERVYEKKGDLRGGLCHTHRRLTNVWKLSVDQMEQISAITTCMICGADGRTMHIDHDHACCPGGRSCGKCVRGYICSGCNTGLGYFRDDINALRRAIEYLGGDGWIGDRTHVLNVGLESET